MVWEWEEDGGKWSPFSADHSQLLSEALIAGDSDTTVQVAPSVKMKIRFDAMTQTNTKTGWQRNIRCVDTSSAAPDTHTVWEWENDSGEWAWFPTQAHQRLLTACKVCQVDSVSVETAPRKQTKVDLTSMNHEMGRGKKFGVRCSSLAGQWTSTTYPPTTLIIFLTHVTHFLLSFLIAPRLPLSLSDSLSPFSPSM